MKNWPQFVNFLVFEHSDSLFRLLLAPCIEKRRRGGLVIRAMNARSSGPNLTGIIILYPLARHVTFTVPLSFQVYNGGSLTECHGIASHPGWSSNTPGHLAYSRCAWNLNWPIRIQLAGKLYTVLTSNTSWLRPIYTYKCITGPVFLFLREKKWRHRRSSMCACACSIYRIRTGSRMIVSSVLWTSRLDTKNWMN